MHICNILHDHCVQGKTLQPRHTTLSLPHGTAVDLSDTCRSTVDGSFFSLSIVDDDISMVIDCRDVDRLVYLLHCCILQEPHSSQCVCNCRFPEGSLYHTEGTWKLLRIGEGPLGFGECVIILLLLDNAHHNACQS